MINYDRIEVPEGNAINKTSVSEQCNICHYWYFLNEGCTFQPFVCNGCHDVLMMPMNLIDDFNSDIAILKFMVFIIIVLSPELEKYLNVK